MIGASIQHYKITAKLGAGGMGEVYRAHDSHLERDVAIKILSPKLVADESARKWFRKEGKLLSKLSHPNIAVVHDFDTAEGMDFLVMELVPGESLAEVLKAGPLPEAQARMLGEQLASALEEAHRNGIIHRDLKPGNVMITPKRQAKVLDFGLAKLLEPPVADLATLDVSHANPAVGTLPYMAPEQLRGNPVDARTDVYALGAILYEMATGRRPFEAKLSTALAADIQTRVPEPPRSVTSSLSADYERITLKCLAKDPAQRYPSAEDLLADLRGTATVARSAGGESGGRKRWRIAAFAAAAILLLAAFYGWRAGGFLGRPPTGPSFDSVAVLPLRNLSGDPEQEYFSAGMHEALIQELARLRGIKVISRTSVMGYKDTQKKIPEIAEELGVDAIVDGSTIRSGNRVRIRVEVIDARNDRHLWAESFDREYGDILSLQSDAATAIALQIRATLTPEDRNAASRSRAVNPEAHELYLKGTFLWTKFFLTEQGLRHCKEYLGRAIEKDPTFALAYTALAHCEWEGGLQGLPSSEGFPRAKVLAQKALELDPNLVDAITIEAAAKFFYDWNWVAAESDLRRAIAAGPNSENAYRLYGYALLWTGRNREALAAFSRAVELAPLSLASNVAQATALMYGGEIDRSIEVLKKTLELDPRYPLARQMMSLAYQQKSNFVDAVREAESAESLSGGNPAFKRALGEAYVSAGRKVEAEKILRELTQLHAQGRARPSHVAALASSLGKMDMAFEWLERAYRERDSGLVFLKISPYFAGLRTDARYKPFLKRMNFPE